jgi:hypothetical protein
MYAKHHREENGVSRSFKGDKRVMFDNENTELTKVVRDQLSFTALTIDSMRFVKMRTGFSLSKHTGNRGKDTGCKEELPVKKRYTIFEYYYQAATSW